MHLFGDADQFDDFSGNRQPVGGLLPIELGDFRIVAVIGQFEVDVLECVLDVIAELVGVDLEVVRRIFPQLAGAILL
jgi:hypothetical protein